MKIIAVTSGKGGTGKSCVAAYTGAALAKQSHKTLLLEMGNTFRSLDLITGVEKHGVFDISDVFAGRCDIEKAIVRTGYNDKLFLLPAAISPLKDVYDDDLRSLLLAISKSTMGVVGVRRP